MPDTPTQRLLIVGASGHARVVADIARRMGSLEITGVCNRSGTGELEGIPVIARDIDVPGRRLTFGTRTLGARARGAQGPDFGGRGHVDHRGWPS